MIRYQYLMQSHFLRLYINIIITKNFKHSLYTNKQQLEHKTYSDMIGNPLIEIVRNMVCVRYMVNLP